MLQKRREEHLIAYMLEGSAWLKLNIYIEVPELCMRWVWDFAKDAWWSVELTSKRKRTEYNLQASRGEIMGKSKQKQKAREETKEAEKKMEWRKKKKVRQESKYVNNHNYKWTKNAD